MSNISTSNPNAIYKYYCNIQTAFDGDDDPLTIANMRFRSIVIDYNFISYNFPLIYTTLSLTYDMVQKLKENQSEGTVVFHLQKYIENSDMPGLKIDVVNEQCVFFMSEDSAKNMEIPMDPDRSDDYGYMVTIGLIALSHVNSNKSAVNGVINSGTMSGTLYYVLNAYSMSLLMEPLTYNNSMSSIIIPPAKSVSKVVKHLNTISAFYSTPYRFFIDFDMAYLLSSSGQGVAKKGETINTVKIYVNNEYTEANMEGMTEDTVNGMYIVSTSAQYAVLTTDEAGDKMYNTISGVSTTGSSENLSVSTLTNNPVTSSSSTIRVPNNNTALLANLQSSMLSSDTLTITKNKADGSVFTLNKYYTIDCGDVYGDQYNGPYLLISKTETYMQEGEGLAMGMVLVFKQYIEG